jgi:hypothetical protein
MLRDSPYRSGDAASIIEVGGQSCSCLNANLNFENGVPVFVTS